MGLIYRHAAATIINLAGIDANAGIRGISRNFEERPQFVAKVRTWLLTAGMKDLLSTLLPSRWYTRGWTFQEEVLSTRAIFLGEDQIYFQCRSSLRMEDRLDEITDPRGLQSTSAMMLSSLIARSGATAAHKFELFHDIVNKYSARKLKYPQDALPAFLGILSSIQQYLGWRFVGALPTAMFDIALHWFIVKDIVAPSGGLDHSSEATVPSLPTWCWTSRMPFTAEIGWPLIRLINCYDVPIVIVRATSDFVIPAYGEMRLIDQEGSLQSKGCLDAASTYVLEHGLDQLTDLLLFTARAISSYQIACQHGELHHAMIDEAGRRCGQMLGLHTDWLRFHDPNHCEIILLSICALQVEDISDDYSLVDWENDLKSDWEEPEGWHEDIFDIDNFGIYHECVCNIMLIEWRGSLAVRIAVGQMHVDAFEAAAPCSEKMIALR
jgi:hypothetical protein